MPLDADDIADLYPRHARQIVGFFARRTLDPEVAVELMAETFAVFVAERRRFRGHGPNAAADWLYGIARHQLSGWVRHAKVERKALSRLGLDPPALSDDELERIIELAGITELRREIDTALGELSNDGDDLRDFPGLTRFGEQLAAAARATAPPRRWSRPPLGPILAALIGIAATATATAVGLHETVVPSPDPQVLPAAQTPVDTTAVVVAPRARDPAGGPPWAMRLTRSQTGSTCAAVGQDRNGVFGIVGEDGVFRAIPVAVSDACSAGLLIGGRMVAAPRSSDLRTIVYGVAGAGIRRATLITTGGRRALPLGDRGTFVAALRGYPEDTAAQVALLGADGRTAIHPLGARAGIVPDVDGAPAWQLERYTLGTRRGV